MRTVDLQYDTIMFENCKRVFLLLQRTLKKKSVKLEGHGI